MARTSTFIILTICFFEVRGNIWLYTSAKQKPHN